MTDKRLTKRQRIGVAHVAAVVSLAAAHLALAPPSAHAADPAGCTRSGDRITCTNGVPKGQTLTGTSGDDTIEITGAVYGTVEGGDGNDTITVTGRDGAPGAHGSSPTQSGGRGESALGSGGQLLGGDGHDIITLTGGNGGRGADGEYSPAKGGHGGRGIKGGVVDGGRGINQITVRGGNGGPGGTSKKGPAGPGGGGPGMEGGRVIVGVDQHSSLVIEGGDGDEQLSNGPEFHGSGGPAVAYGTVEGGAAPEGVSIRATGGDSGRGTRGAAGGVGLGYGTRLIGTPGDDEITLESGMNRSGGPRAAGLVLPKSFDAKAGNDTITVHGSTGFVKCGAGEDTYNYTGRRGFPDRTCEHINRIQ
ncbi:hypothetical protein [Streptomyces sp. URMC 123]|uniref:hypothetical protein n=1 Tax=Streptomyces sp. URMC 123 TaxID=3423403 RepID=UPI003F1A4526